MERSPFINSINSKDSPPIDKGYLVYLIVLLNGVGALMPWNMFITIAPQYYVQYWFSVNGTETEYSLKFMSSLGVASQGPNVLINIVNIFLVCGGPLLLRIIGPLVLNCLNILAVILLIIFVPPSEEDMKWFYFATLGIVALMNLFNGLYQNSLFGLFADFPPQYTNALILGNNICGTFTTVLSMVVTMLFPNDPKTVAIIYFSISLVVLIICLISMLTIVKQRFYKYYVDKGNRARELDSSGRPSFSDYTKCFGMCWVQLWNVFFIFFVTLTIFPAMMVWTPLYRNEGEEWYSIWPEKLYIAITTFLTFNVFATLGSFTANFVQFPKPRFLWIPVLLRGLLIPFFMFCNYRPLQRTLPVIFKNEWFFFGGAVVMAYTSGYFSSLAMMYAPRVVPQSLGKIAGMTAALCLILGIFAGVSFTVVIELLTSL